MVLIAALVADQLFRLLRDLGFPLQYALLAWLAVALCYPMLVFSSQIYPELPAALLIVGALRVMVRWATAPVALALGSSAAALLVWLHVRFIPLAGALLFGLVVAACRSRRRGTVSPRESGLVRAAGRELMFYAGVLTKPAENRDFSLDGPISGLARALRRRLVSLVRDRPTRSGVRRLLPPPCRVRRLVVPVRVRAGRPARSRPRLDPVRPCGYWLGLAALGCLVLKWRWAAVACIAVSAGYELLVASTAVTPGWSFPARYPDLADRAHRSADGARARGDPRDASSYRSRYSLSRSFSRLRPSATLSGFTPQPTGRGCSARERLLTSSPSRIPSHTRRRTSTRLVSSGRRLGRCRERSPWPNPGDRPGYLLFGPFAPLRHGSYRATFQLAATAAHPTRGLRRSTSSAPCPTASWLFAR